MVTDPIADYLTRMRNAIAAKHRIVEIPSCDKDFCHLGVEACQQPRFAPLCLCR